MKIIKEKEKNLADRLKEIRLKRDISQGELARLAGIDRKTINRIENYHFSPNFETLLRICYVLDTEISALTKGI